MPITIHGAGCALMDFLFTDVDFTAPAVERLLEKTPGDGGLTIGGLVFAEALEQAAGRPVDEILASIVGAREPDRRNVGGPAIVSLIHTAQIFPEADVVFYGAVGADRPGAELFEIVARTPLGTTGLAARDGETAATWVLSDPGYGGGHGERLFINRLGVAARITPDDLGPEFPNADIVQLGGTALVPRLHDALPVLLREAREAGALTVVNTVYDFRAQMRAPGERWTLGSDEAYPLVDLLVTDA
ncbi:MAG: carbohydrate kinase family protein, partial [Spirochaetota bacterium]